MVLISKDVSFGLNLEIMVNISIRINSLDFCVSTHLPKLRKYSYRTYQPSSKQLKWPKIVC